MGCLAARKSEHGVVFSRRSACAHLGEYQGKSLKRTPLRVAGHQLEKTPVLGGSFLIAGLFGNHGAQVKNTGIDQRLERGWSSHRWNRRVAQIGRGPGDISGFHERPRKQHARWLVRARWCVQFDLT